ncbi:thioredoxin domain-containing protein 12-like [Eriocheir sinensis]|uniref:thioredoxin domain-containing protein 12-like n=1 Tax=Eriocheir sinensis TaxID=95602 RepID=UPI0021C5896E|nr:thioredoxin domain-containing protein 12-like [Eriocheir sinensis]
MGGKVNLLLVFSLVLTLLRQRTLASEDAGHGLGEQYEWHTLEEGLEISRETGKPLMFIIHKSWCGACRAFKPKFAASAAALELSQHFVMVNAVDDEEPKDTKYEPDGGYIPRILFLDSKGDVRQEIYNKKGKPQYKFFYFDDVSVVESMRQAKDLLAPENTRDEL